MTAAVYLGSSDGRSPKYRENAYRLGRLLAEAGIAVVYGGAGVGTMKALAEGVLDAGGSLTGVMPKGFKGRSNYAAQGIDVRLNVPGVHFIETSDMGSRIATMERLSDVCIILPGSHGTMHEFFSYFTGIELGNFERRMAILNTDGYYDSLLEQLNKMREEGFSPEEDSSRLIVAATPEELVQRLV